MTNETPQIKNKKNLHLQVTSTEALAAKYPDAVKKVVVVKEDHKRLYELAKAHFVLNAPIPGVIITHPDGRVLDGSALGQPEAVGQADGQ